MNNYWDSKVAIITGATHGIGLRLAERLSEKSVKISTIYRNNDDQANDLKKIINNNGSELFIIKDNIVDKNNIKVL
jgi:3-oxoacyl-[acyl-carrier protein] reductase